MRFFFWYYTGALRGFFVVWGNYLVRAFDFFSTADLAATLFSPWHRDVSPKDWRGFQPLKSLRRIAENIFSRFLGAIVRLCVIFVSLVWAGMVLAIGAVLLFLWVFAPVLIAISPGFVLFFGVASAVLGASVAVVLFSVWCFSRSRDISPAKKTLEKLWSEPFFDRILARVGVERSETPPEILSSEQEREAFFIEKNIRKENFVEALSWELSLVEARWKRSRFWSRENLFRGRSIGREWKYGYTPALDEVSEDMFAVLSRKFRTMEVCARPETLDLLALILSRSDQNNALVAGTPGSGRKTLVEWFVKLVYERNLEGPFRDARILRLDIERVIARNAGNLKQSANHLEYLFAQAAYAGNVTLVIDDIEYYLGERAADNGNPDIAPILEKYLPVPSFRVIATMSSEGFHTYAERGRGLLKHMERIEIEEIGAPTAMRVLLDEFSDLERERVVFTIKALRHIVEQSGRFNAAVPDPERSLDLAKEVLVFWQNHPKRERIDSSVVNEYLALKTGVPTGAISGAQKETLLNLEGIMAERIVGQRPAIEHIAKALRKARSGISGSMRPIGSFLFLGPTGVGKTETAKVLSRTYFGGEAGMVRLDMSEFQLPGSAAELIGSRETGTAGRLVKLVRDNPYGVLLLDELEKAHGGVLDIFLQILDEGFFTDAFGTKVRLNNLILIATSNAGAPQIKSYFEEHPGEGTEAIEKEVIDDIVENGVFRVEFLNRFDGVVFFAPLSHEEILAVAQILLREFAEGVWKNKRITVSFEDGVAEAVVRLGYEPSFGARSVRRYIADTVEAKVAEKIIAEETPENGAIVVREEGLR